jgi:hypothetical protein
MIMGVKDTGSEGWQKGKVSNRAEQSEHVWKGISDRTPNEDEIDHSNDFLHLNNYRKNEWTSSEFLREISSRRIRN